MRKPPSSPWIVRCSVQLYRWLLCLGPHPYRRQYADRTLQLFRECSLDAYGQRGIPGVLGLWLPLFSDLVAQMLAEHLSELQHASELQVSVETVSPSAWERTPAMNSAWQRFNRNWAIPAFSAITLFRRKLTRPLKTLMSKVGVITFFRTLFPAKTSQVEQELWLKHPANMHFEQRLRHWITVGDSRTHESGVVTPDPQGRASAFLGSTQASPSMLATLRQTIKADDYQGKLLRFSGDIKVEQVEQQAGLYIRTSRREERLRPETVVRGTHDWMRYEATIPVAQDATFIRFGLALYGKGRIWLANARLEVIEQDGMLSASL